LILMVPGAESNHRHCDFQSHCILNDNNMLRLIDFGKPAYLDQ
jgi:hypothetical protein